MAVFARTMYVTLERIQFCAMLRDVFFIAQTRFVKNVDRVMSYVKRVL